MKRIIIFIVFIVIFLRNEDVYGQNEKKQFYGGYYTFGACNYKSRSTNVFSNSETEIKNYFGIGFDYRRFDIYEFVDLCMGLTITRNNGFEKTSNWTGQGGRGYSTYDKSFFILSLPIHLRVNFINIMFLGGGPCLNIQSHMDKTFGVGFVAVGGLEYIFNSGVAVSVSHQRQWNWLNKKSDTNIYLNSNILSQTGFNLGLGYKF